jgi:hypothetical protein
MRYFQIMVSGVLWDYVNEVESAVSYNITVRGKLFSLLSGPVDTSFWCPSEQAAMNMRPVRLAYLLPASSTFLSE